MKKFKSLLIVLMALLVLTGCEFNSSKKDDKKDNDTKTEEKAKDNKNDSKDGNSLSCSMKISGMDSKMVYTWNNGKISTIKVVVSINLSSYNIDDSVLDIVAQSMGSEYMNQIKESYGLPENQEGFEINYGVNKETKSIEVSIYVDVNKIDPALLNNSNLFKKEDLTKSYNEIKSQLVSSGATCE